MVNDKYSPTIKFKDKILLITIPEIYSFAECWKMFMEEIPNSKLFNEAKAVAIDFSKMKGLTELGMSSEAIILLNKFLESGKQETYIIGISETFKNIYLEMCKEDFQKHKQIKDYKEIKIK
jgi:hypothetical protein